MKWARKFLTDEQMGPEPKKPSEVVTPGDVIYVEALPKTAENANTGLYALAPSAEGQRRLDRHGSAHRARAGARRRL